MAIATVPIDQRVIDIDSRRFASVEKALVELITNCDDSYARLENTGTPVTGHIRITYERHQAGALLVVADQAEGMSLNGFVLVWFMAGPIALWRAAKAAGAVISAVA